MKKKVYYYYYKILGKIEGAIEEIKKELENLKISIEKKAISFARNNYTNTHSQQPRRKIIFQKTFNHPLEGHDLFLFIKQNPDSVYSGKKKFIKNIYYKKNRLCL
jgi:hypothetical protein